MSTIKQETTYFMVFIVFAYITSPICTLWNYRNVTRVLIEKKPLVM